MHAMLSFVFLCLLCFRLVILLVYVFIVYLYPCAAHCVYSNTWNEMQPNNNTFNFLYTNKQVQSKESLIMSRSHTTCYSIIWFISSSYQAHHSTVPVCCYHLLVVGAASSCTSGKQRSETNGRWPRAAWVNCSSKNCGGIMEPRTPWMEMGSHSRTAISK